MPTEKEYPIIIIGAGAAGLYCAAHLAAQQTPALLLEKNSQPGRKLLLTGGGHCNITHHAKPSEILPHYGTLNRSLRPVLFAHPSAAVMDWFRQRGVELTTDNTGRVLPLRGGAGAVLEALINSAGTGGEIRCGQAVEEFVREGSCFRLHTGERRYLAHMVILTMGGQSYPHTGSTGDAWPWLKKLGHTIRTPRPALTPLLIRNFLFSDCAGISLESPRIVLRRAGKNLHVSRGELLFTHRGLSGPAVLDLSRYTEPGDVISLCLLPVYDPESWDELLRTASHGRPHTLVRTLLKEQGISEKLAARVLDTARLSPQISLSELSRERRRQIVNGTLEQEFSIEQRADFRMAMITQGGVPLDEVDLTTMQSRLVPGLFFAGEVLDVDGDSGGYNLQWAWSSAWVAAQGAASLSSEPII